jgi:hypothetical protein
LEYEDALARTAILRRDGRGRRRDAMQAAGADSAARLGANH